MSDKLKEHWETIKGIGILLALVSSLAGVGASIWKGGELSKVVEIDHLDIQALKAAGTPSLRAHEAMDTERINNLSQRLERVERACETFAQIQKDLSEVKVAVEFMTGKRQSLPMPVGKPSAGGYSY